MTTNSILLAVADPQTLIDITQALGPGWDVTSVASEEDALAQFERRSFDGLLVDFNLVSPDASDLLNQIGEKHPETIRFLLAYEADLALVAAKVQGTSQILAKPVEPASLKSRIENGINDSKSKESDVTNAPGSAPSIPTVYAQVLKAVQMPGATSEQVGETIALDASLTSEILRLANSSYLGLPRNITRPVEAVESVGLEAIKAVVMALQFLAEHSRLKPAYLSLGQIWQHSINVGLIARDLVLFETKDRALASQALTAGLLHDLGKVVLATNFDDLYGRVHSLARKQPVALWDIEKEMFGANHGEIGGCLLGMWNMPLAIVEAAALHHEPPLGEHEELTPLAAVHIANVLERELWPDREEMPVAPIVNTPFLNELGLLHRMPVWRAALANRRSVDLLAEAASAETERSASSALSTVPASRTGNHLPGPAATTRTSSSAQPGSGDESWPVLANHYQRSWVYAGVAAILILVVLWFKIPSANNQSEMAYARTPAAQETAPAASSTPSTQKIPVAAPQAASPVVIADEPPAAPASSERAPKPAASLPAAEPAPATVPKATVPLSVATEKARPDFRLNGIIYSSARPSAIINGQRVNVGDEVDGATVAAIKPTTVTLEINGQRKTYTLR